ALRQARGTQQQLDEWRSLARDALASTAFTPSILRHEGELVRSERNAVLADQAMRNARVLARRAVFVADQPGGAVHVGDLLQKVSEAVMLLIGEWRSGRDGAAVRPALIQVAKALDPHEYAGWQGQ